MRGVSGAWGDGLKQAEQSYSNCHLCFHASFYMVKYVMEYVCLMDPLFLLQGSCRWWVVETGLQGL